MQDEILIRESVEIFLSFLRRDLEIWGLRIDSINKYVDPSSFSISNHIYRFQISGVIVFENFRYIEKFCNNFQQEAYLVSNPDFFRKYESDDMQPPSDLVSVKYRTNFGMHLALRTPTDINDYANKIIEDAQELLYKKFSQDFDKEVEKELGE